MDLYTAYALNFASALPLPELQPGQAGAAPDVEITFGAVAPPEPSEIEGGTCFKKLPSGDALLHWDWAGSFLVRGGREIIVHPQPEADPRILRLGLLGPCMGILLHQRGLVTLHASAVAAGGGAVAFVGMKGSGKSTTVATLQAHGYPLLADDIVALDGREGEAPGVFSGFPQIKLWPDAAQALGQNLDDLPLLHPEIEKRGLRGAALEHGHGQRLLRVYVLSRKDEPAFESVRLSLRDAFLQLLTHAYAARFLGSAAAGPALFQRYQQLVRHVPLYYLKRPRDLNRLSELPAFIARDLETAQTDASADLPVSEA